MEFDSIVIVFVYNEREELRTANVVVTGVKSIYQCMLEIHISIVAPLLRMYGNITVYTHWQNSIRLQIYTNST